MNSHKHNNIVEQHMVLNSPHHDAAAVLAEKTSLSKQQIKQAMHKGAVWLSRGKHTARLRRHKRALKHGDELHLYYNPEVLEQTTEPAERLFDCQGYSLWYKPSGMLCQGSKWGDHNTIQRFIETHDEHQRPVFLVHRLDRAASGLILLAHSKKTCAALVKLFELREIEKSYQAIVEGLLPTETLSIETAIDGKPATSHVQVINKQNQERQASEQKTLLNIHIETGRKHQIRKHLAQQGHPIIGDRLYGSGHEHSPDLQLRSYRLAFICPISGEQKDFHLPESHHLKF